MIARQHTLGARKGGDPISVTAAIRTPDVGLMFGAVMILWLVLTWIFWMIWRITDGSE